MKHEQGKNTKCRLPLNAIDLPAAGKWVHTKLSQSAVPRRGAHPLRGLLYPPLQGGNTFT
jgi:hypothetical protein